ncbi:MAG: hypothetical protein IT384_27280 [Deltaproteobacteria bacterium]|nr:hypothetical protein [Deltaproteobacteria bacterium]
MSTLLPSGWGIATLAVHTPPESGGPAYVGTIVASLRMDISGDARPKDVAEIDRLALHAGNAGKVVAHGDLSLAGAAYPHLEVAAEGPGGLALKQWMLYAERGDQIYTIVATHRKDRFESLMPGLLRVLEAL